MNQVIEDLKAAREIVKDHWYKGALTDEQGNYCIVGAINMTVSGSAYMFDTHRRWAAEEALVAHLPENLRSFGIPSFNDDDSTTHADVMTLFDKTLADLGGLA